MGRYESHEYQGWHESHVIRVGVKHMSDRVDSNHMNVRVGMNHMNVRVGMNHMNVRVGMYHMNIRVWMNHMTVRVGMNHMSDRVAMYHMNIRVEINHVNVKVGMNHMNIRIGMNHVVDMIHMNIRVEMNHISVRVGYQGWHESHEYQGLDESLEYQGLDESHEYQGLDESHEYQGLNVSHEYQVGMYHMSVRVEINNVNIRVGMNHVSDMVEINDVNVRVGINHDLVIQENVFFSRGYPPEHTPGKTTILENSEGLSPHGSPNITKGESLVEEEEEEDTIHDMRKLQLDDSTLATGMKNTDIKDLRVEIVQLKRQMREERIARAKADQLVVKFRLENKKLFDENQRLKQMRGGSILDDDSVLDSIEASFKQFHEFLDLLRDAGLGQLITMAGLDKQGSPFSMTSEKPFSKHSKLSKFPSKSNGYQGDISSDGHINGSYKTKALQQGLNGSNLRPKSYLSTQDPTMKGLSSGSGGDGFKEDKKSRPADDLYDRLRQETSGIFQHMGDEDHSANITADSGKHHDSSNEDRRARRKSPLPQSDKKTEESPRSPRLEKLGLRGPEGEVIMSLSPFDSDHSKDHFNQSDERDLNTARDTERSEFPDKGLASRHSDFNYSMESFEQSYLSERGEMVHLGDDLELASPLPQEQIDSDEEDF
ncbi:hypothetical protein ACJMK2_025374 [Sinanodonta woodiana]|uniref:Uncharacterized protein n=1 Tax=Sinanodonta woodiana TaxID=1069815 RepID=A0ABD3XG98_SINWO